MTARIPLETLDNTLDTLAHHPRARTWRAYFRFGHGAGAGEREVTLLAPVDRVGTVLLRIHNGILLLHPAAVRIAAPVAEDALQPALGALRSLHAIPIQVNDGPAPAQQDGAVDLPSVETPPPPVLRPGELALGLDIGGTGMKACALRDGVLLRCAQARTWPDGEQGVDSLVARARALLDEVRQGEPAGTLGVGFASPMGVGGQVISLSTVMQQRLGGVEQLRDFPARVAEGVVGGRVAFFNDLANLGRYLSGAGRRRLLRVQVGTSFGGCWIDADGTVNASELGRLVVDAAPGARAHTYLPLKGAMKSYLSNYGVAISLSERLGREISPAEAGFVWRDLCEAQDPVGDAVLDWVVELLVGVVAEARVFLPGLNEAELGGSMLQGPTGRRLRRRLDALPGPVRIVLARDPGYDGALAAARAPLLATPLRGMRRLAAGG